jgi:hypothetical protein
MMTSLNGGGTYKAITTTNALTDMFVENQQGNGAALAYSYAKFAAQDLSLANPYPPFVVSPANFPYDGALVEIMVVGKEAGSGDSAMWSISGLVTVDTAGNATLASKATAAVAPDQFQGTGGAWTVTLSVTKTNQLRIQVVGQASGTINWKAIAGLVM